MLELRTLGQLDLRPPAGAPLERVLAQPKRCALLAYLAIASPSGYCHRELLLPMFWPELDAARARRALRQSTYFLRRTLGGEVLRSRSDVEVGVDGAALWCDANAFRAAVRGADWAVAEALYRGDLLPGLFVEGSSDFETWLEAERTELRQLAAQALWQLTELSLATGRLGDAASQAKRAASFAPADETVLRRLLITLERAGDGAAAAHAYQVFARRLVQEYDLTPSPPTRALAERIRLDCGSAAPTAVPAAPLPPTHAALETSTPPVHFGRAPRRARFLARYAAGVLLVLAGLAVLSGLREATPSLSSGAFAVVPFAATGPDSTFWSEAAMQLLGVSLDGVAGLRRTDVRAVLGAGHGAADAERALRAARRAGAGHVLFGRAVAGENDVVLSVEVLEAGTGRAAGTVSVQGPRDQPAALVDRLAQAVITRTPLVEVKPLSPGAILWASNTASLDALRAWVAGESHFRRSRFDDAYREFTRAVEWDSTFALAHLRRWQSAAFGEMMYTEPWPMTAARHADGLGPRERALVASLTQPLANTTIAPLERLVGRYPDDPELLFQLADRYFHERGATSDRRFAGAFQRVLELDPSFGAAYLHLVEDAFARGDRDGALRLLGRMRRLEPRAAAQYDLATVLAWGSAREKRRALAALDTAPAYALERALRALPAATRFAPVRRAVAEALAASRHPPISRGQAHAALVRLHFLDGDPVRAAAAFERAEPSRAAAGAFVRHYLLWHLAGAVLDTVVADAAAAALEPAVVTSQRWLAGAYALRRGRLAQYQREVEALEVAHADSASPRLYREANLLASRALRAIAAHDRGDPAAGDSMLAVLRAPGIWAIADPVADLWRAHAAHFLLAAGRVHEAQLQLATLAREGEDLVQPLRIMAARAQRAGASAPSYSSRKISPAERNGPE